MTLMSSKISAYKIIQNPGFDEIKQWMNNNPHAVKTKYNNYSVQTKVTARSNESTFFVTKENESQNSISRVEYDRIAKIQNDHINCTEMVQIDGFIGPDEDFRIPSQVLVERKHAHIAAMQKQLYFCGKNGKELLFKVIITPSLKVQGFPKQRVIMVDLENWTTRVIGSDYFGESKKGGLRMWNELVFMRGGLALHAGCKVFKPSNDLEELALIIGLSGTGKTTTTFFQQIESLPVQDDFCALFPQGKVYASENGCFAKTYGLSEEDEPVIFKALSRPESWLENVKTSPNGDVDFLDGSYTTNGRGTFGLDAIPHRSPKNLPPVKYIFLLNRNQNIIPAVVKLNQEQAARYFMLGETTGTSAGGAAEEGKSLRIPGTNPFFTRDDAFQGNRFYELIQTIPDLQIYLLNTGRIGGSENDERSIKIKIRHSSAIIRGIIQKSIIWQKDPDFNYLIAGSIPSFKQNELLNPRILYDKQNRLPEYFDHVKKLKEERKIFLDCFSNLNQLIRN